VSPNLFSYLLKGLLPPETEVDDRALPAACADFIDARQWHKVLELATFDCFEDLPADIEKQADKWRDFVTINSNSTSPSIIVPPPSTMITNLPLFAHILLHKVLRSDLVFSSIHSFIEKALGPQFVLPASPNLKELYD
jgi:hypothetical protein